MQKRRLLLVIMLCAFWLMGFAQNAIKGTVKDKTGEPLIGVSVTYGNGQGTVTDIDGNFSVNAPAGTSIKLSYVGYKPQTVKGSGNMNITLEEDNTTLEDVVVVGYGTMKRRDLTGAVASVSGETLAKNPVSNIAQALQGQLPGVSVMEFARSTFENWPFRPEWNSIMTGSGFLSGFQTTAITVLAALMISLIKLRKYSIKSGRFLMMNRSVETE